MDLETNLNFENDNMNNLYPNEKILWNRTRKKKILGDNSELYTSLIISLICLSSLTFLAFYIEYNDAILWIFLMVLFLFSLSVCGIVYKIYEWLAQKKVPLEKEEMKNYRESDVITNKRLIQRKLYNFSIDLPKFWSRALSKFGYFNPELYPHALEKKREDLLILNLKKINLMINNEFLEKIYFIEKYIIETNERVVNHTENVFWFEEAYNGVVNISFENNREEQQILKNIIKNEFNFKLIFENEDGQIFAQEDFTPKGNHQIS